MKLKSKVVIIFTKTLAKELALTILVNAVAPAPLRAQHLRMFQKKLEMLS